MSNWLRMSVTLQKDLGTIGQFVNLLTSNSTSRRQPKYNFLKINNGSHLTHLNVTFFYGWMRFGALSVADCVLHSLSHAFFGDFQRYGSFNFLGSAPSSQSTFLSYRLEWGTFRRYRFAQLFASRSPLARALFILKFLLWVGHRGKTESRLGHIGSLYCPLAEENIWQETMCTLFVSLEGRCFFVLAAWWGGCQ